MEWKLSELSVDGKGHYGIGAPAIPYDKNKPTYLRITDINDDGTINFLDLKSVDDEDSNKYLLKENDIVFARTGNSTGRSYFYQKEHGDFVYAGFLIKFSIDPQKVNPKILKYYTHSQEYYNWVKSFDTGGTRGNINAKTFGDMPISLPKRCVQDKIVGILSALDSKIENNNKINANLEAQAEALFKSWFVDFTPFKDQPFVDSELGPIPQGWKVGKLGDYCETICRGLTPKYNLDSKEIVLGQTCVRNNIVTLNNARKHQPKGKTEKKVQQWDTLINSTGIGSLGRVGIVYFDYNYVSFDSHITVVRATNPLLRPYIGRNLVSRQLEIENLAIGSTGQTELPRESVKSITLYIPTQKVLESFNGIIKPLSLKILKNIQENQRLAALRDTLLPKLMSGEIKL